MVENEIRNYKVFVNLSKDPISYHFPGNECTYPKDLFHRHHCIQSQSVTNSWPYSSQTHSRPM